MKTKIYKVNRDNVYVGEVVKTDTIYRWNEEYEFFRTKPGQLNTGNYFPYRSMLFVPNEENLANDLLYRSPNYPILNITEDNICLNFEKGNIVVKESYNLSELLKYYGFDQYLTFEDIILIRKTFFTGNFAKDHCHLFGWKETMAESVTFYTNGNIVTDPKELEKLRTKFRKKQQAGHRMFIGTSENILPREYWDILDARGDNSLMDAIEWNQKMNAFKPHKQEGPIKKLSRF